MGDERARERERAGLASAARRGGGSIRRRKTISEEPTEIARYTKIEEIVRFPNIRIYIVRFSLNV